MPVQFAPPKTAPRLRTASAPMPQRGTLAQYGVQAEREITDKKNKKSLEDHTIGALNNVSRASMMLTMPGAIILPFFPWPLPLPQWGANALRKVGIKSAAPAVEIVTQAPIEALRKVDAANWYQLPEQYFRDVADIATKSDGKLISHVAGTATKVADFSRDRLAPMGQRVNATIAPVASSVGSSVKKGIADFSQTGVGKHVEGGIDGLISHSIKANEKRAAKALGKATEKIGQEVPGFGKRFMNFVMRRKPETIGVAEGLADIQAQLAKGNVQSGFEALRSTLESATASKNALNKSAEFIKANKLEDALKSLSDVATHSKASQDALTQARSLLEKGDAKAGLEALGNVWGSAEKQMFQQGSNVFQHVQKAAQTGGKAAGLKNVLNTGLSGFASAAAKAAKGTKMWHVALATTIAAGIAAIILTNNKTNKEGRKVLKDMKVDFGDKHPIYVAARKAEGGMQFRRTTESVLGAASQGLYIIAPGAAFALGMAPAMGLPLLIKENETANAYAILQQASQGKLKIEPTQLAHAVNLLLAEVPEIKAHGGMRNELASAVSKEMVDRNYSLSQITSVLKDKSKLDGLTVEVFEKQQAAKQAAEAPKAAEPVKAAGPTITPANDGPEAKLTAQPYKIPAPVGKIELGTVANEGRIDEQTRARA